MMLIDLIERADHRVVVSLQAAMRPTVVTAFKWVSRTGDGYAQVFCIVLAFWLASEAAQSFLHAAALAFSIERVLYLVAKRRFKRRRPEKALLAFRAWVTPADEFSFPSGHTMAAFLLATLLVSSFNLLPGWVFLWAALVGASRVALGVHFPSDVIVGAVLGVSIGMLALGTI